MVEVKERPRKVSCSYRMMSATVCAADAGNAATQANAKAMCRNGRSADSREGIRMKVT